jgi:RNA polymerase sigma-70 factor (ECF subfamily)
MSPEETEFALLMERIRAGCPQAAQEVFRRYSEHIRRIIRRHLHQRLRRQLDSTDFLQSVWKSFFQLPEKYTFDSPEQLIAFLAAMAHNKVVDEFRRNLRSERHNVNRERPLPAASDSAQAQAVPAVRQPTPSEIAIAQEHWERLLKDQPPENRQALEMLRQGYSQREIAKQLAIHPKRLQRLLQKLSHTVD